MTLPSEFSRCRGKLPTALAVAVWLALYAWPAHAIEIFGFSNAGAFSSNNAPGSGSISLAQGDAVGGEVDFRYEYTAGVGRLFVETDGVFLQATNPTMQVDTVFQFDGSADDPAQQLDPTGLGGVDLTESGSANALLLDVYVNDQPATVTVTVSGNSGGAATGQFNLTGGLLDPLTATTFSLPFAAFVGDDVLDDAGAVELLIDAEDGADLVIDNLRSGTAAGNPSAPTFPGLEPLQPVPPGALLIDGFNLGSASSFNIDGGAASVSAADNVDAIGLARALIVIGGVKQAPGSVDDGATFGFNSSEFGGAAFLHSGPVIHDYEFTINWDGSADFGLDNMGLGSVDLTDGGANDAFWLGLRYNDTPNTIQLTVWSGGGAASDTAVFDLPGSLFLDGGKAPLPFTAFNGVDFTDVSAMQLNFASEFAQDIAIDYLVAASLTLPASEPNAAPAQPVPLPKSPAYLILMVTLLAAMALSGLRRLVG